MTDFNTLPPAAQLECLESAGREALANWSIGGASLDMIKHRENAVFRVENDCFKGALRLHRMGYHSNAELRSELHWMQVLSKAGVRVPNVVPAESGDLFVTHRSDALPAELQIDLFEWIDGRQLGSVEEGVADEADVEPTYRALGELAAQVHNQSSTWTPPAWFERHSWDANGLAGDNPFWGDFWNLESASKSESEILRRGRDKVYADLGRLPKTKSNYSMIHADFAPENVMVDSGGVRLIDFDDAGFGWHLFELATSLYFIQGKSYFEQAKDAMIAGYRLHRELPESEFEFLPLLFLARGFTYIGWVHTRQETETARELTPMILALACELADDYLKK